MANFNDTTPAAPASPYRNGKWQYSGRSVSVYMPRRYDLDYFGGLWGVRLSSNTVNQSFALWGTGNTGTSNEELVGAPVDGWVRSMNLRTAADQQQGTTISVRMWHDGIDSHLATVLPPVGPIGTYADYEDAIAVKKGERFGFRINRSGAGGGATLYNISGEFATTDGSCIFGWNGKNATVATNTVEYAFPGSDAKGATESEYSIKIGFACTVSSLFLSTNTAQPASGSLVVTLRKNGGATTLTYTLASSTAAGQFADLTNSFTCVAGDTLSIEIDNNATLAASAQIRSITFKVLPTSAALPSIVPGYANTTMTGTATYYYNLFSDLVTAPGSSNEIAYPMPLAGTLKDFKVQGGTAGNADSTLVWELYKNGAATGYKKSLGGDVATAWFDADGGSEVTVALGDLVWVQVSHTGAGSDPIFGITMTFEPDLP